MSDDNKPEHDHTDEGICPNCGEDHSKFPVVEEMAAKLSKSTIMAVNMLAPLNQVGSVPVLAAMVEMLICYLLDGTSVDAEKAATIRDKFSVEWATFHEKLEAGDPAAIGMFLLWEGVAARRIQAEMKTKMADTVVVPTVESVN